MALTGVKRSNASWLMRMYPHKKVASQINKATPVANQFAKRARSFEEGEKFAIPIETELSDAGGYRGEGDDIPVADRVKGQFGYATFKTYLRTIQLTGQAHRYGGSVVNHLTHEVKGLVQAARIDTDRDLFLPSRGEHATVLDASSATALTVSSYQYINVGMRIDVLVASTGAVSNGVTDAKITAITKNSPANGQAAITIDENLGAYASVDTTYAIYRHNEYNEKPFSLLEIVDSADPDSANYLEIDRDTYPIWGAYELDADSETADGAMFASCQTEIGLLSGMQADIIYVHPYVENDLLAGAIVDRRYIKEKDFEIWGRRASLNGVPIVGVRHCPFDTALFLSLDTWEVAYPKGMNPDGEWDLFGLDEGPRMARVPNKWAHEALWVRPRQYICTQPNANGKITGINWSPTGTV